MLPIPRSLVCTPFSGGGDLGIGWVWLVGYLVATEPEEGFLVIPGMKTDRLGSKANYMLGWRTIWLLERPEGCTGWPSLG